MNYFPCLIYICNENKHRICKSPEEIPIGAPIKIIETNVEFSDENQIEKEDQEPILVRGKLVDIEGFPIKTEEEKQETIKAFGEFVEAYEKEARESRAAYLKSGYPDDGH